MSSAGDDLPPPQLAVAVINYNTRDQLERCLRSLPATVDDRPVQRLVVDNASSDGSAEMVARTFAGQVELRANSTNVGFGRAVNEAMAHTSAPFVLLLNADTEAPEGAIEELLHFMLRTPDAGVAGGRLVDASGQLQHSCRTFYTPTTVLMRRTPLGRLMPNHPSIRQHLMLDWAHDEVRQVDWMQGACLLLRRAAMDQIGGMDERFFLYFEDVDLCRRMAEAGHGVYYVPQATFVHHYRRGSHGGRLSAEKLHHLQSAVRYLVKWNGRATRLLHALRWLAPLLLLLLDLALINASLLLGLRLAAALGLPPPAPLGAQWDWRWTLAGGNVFLTTAFAAAGLYRLDPARDWLALTAAVFRAVALTAAVGVLLAALLPPLSAGLGHTRTIAAMVLALVVVAVASSRALLRGLLRACWSRRLLTRRALLVGPSEQVARMADALRGEPRQGYEVAGLFTAEAAAAGAEPQAGHSDSLLPRFRRHLDRSDARTVFFITSKRTETSHVPLLLHCFEQDIEVRVTTAAKLLPFLDSPVREVCGYPAVDVTRPPFYSVKRLLKRLGDLLATLAMLPLVLPVILLLALLIRLCDGGPSFFRQRRVGKGGRSFVLFKLRTMRVNATVDAAANIAEGPMTRIPNDPRVTRLGAWLRKHKLDELPQLINVLAGHMSLVGPRPPTGEEVEQYTEWQRCRLTIRPGLTGLWQIDKQRKWRFDEMVELDLRYILNWSLLLDYSVILRTIPAVLRGS